MINPHVPDPDQVLRIAAAVASYYHELTVRGVPNTDAVNMASSFGSSILLTGKLADPPSNPWDAP